jgi:hypothetical protein
MILGLVWGVKIIKKRMKINTKNRVEKTSKQKSKNYQKVKNNLALGGGGEAHGL